MASVLILQGCASLPVPDESGTGRFLIFTQLVHKGGSGPWYDYQMWVRNTESGEKHAINIKVDQKNGYTLSRPLPPGAYEIYDWNLIAKNVNRTYDYDINGGFKIEKDSITIFDHEMMVIVDPKSQRFGFNKRDAGFKDKKYQELKEKNENLAAWDIYWVPTTQVTWKNK